MTRTLYLHVGTHKTGSTSIQSALSALAPALLSRGIACYPERQSYQLVHHFLRSEVQTPRRMKRQMPSDFDAFRAAITGFRKAAGDSGDMILSNEALCFLRQPLEQFGLSRVLGAKFKRIVPIVILRDPAGWRDSWENQLMGMGVLDRQRQLPDAQGVIGPWYYDTEAIKAFWAGFGDMVVIDYDQAVASTATEAAPGSILPAFGAAIGQPDLFRDLDFRMNTRKVDLA